MTNSNIAESLSSRIKTFQEKHSFIVENKTAGKKEFETYLVKENAQNYIRVTHPLSYWVKPSRKDQLENKNQEALLAELKKIPMDQMLTVENVQSLLKSSAQAAKDRFQNAGKVGSSVHAYIENGKANEDVPEELRPQVEKGIKAYEQFKATNTMQCLTKELKIFSQTFGVAGTIDDVSWDGANVYVTDWKTGQYDAKMGWQVAMYGLMFKEHFGIEPKLRLIMLDKYSGKVTPINYEHNSHLEACYLGVLQAFAGENWKALREFWPWALQEFHTERKRS